MSLHSSAPSGRNFELHKAFLRDQQRRISGHLFEIGVVSQLLQHNAPDAGAVADLTGLAQIGKEFVPSFASSDEADKGEKELSLAAITPTDHGRSFTCFKLGMVDETNTLYPYQEINNDDAQAVLDAAMIC